VDEPIFAIEGALGTFSAAVLDGERLVASGLDGRDALERGLGNVRDVLREANLSLDRLRGIAVGIGPGGFTGLRIAVAFAKSLAFGASLPLVGVSSFDILDAAAQAEELFPRLTVVFGRTGVVCVRRSERSACRVACGPIDTTIARLLPADAPLTIVGATEDVRSAVLERATSVHFVSCAPELPAATLARIARLRVPAPSVHAIAPDYGEVPAVNVK